MDSLCMKVAKPLTTVALLGTMPLLEFQLTEGVAKSQTTDAHNSERCILHRHCFPSNFIGFELLAIFEYWPTPCRALTTKAGLKRRFVSPPRRMQPAA